MHFHPPFETQAQAPKDSPLHRVPLETGTHAKEQPGPLGALREMTEVERTK